jgi:hypothetical protein
MIAWIVLAASQGQPLSTVDPAFQLASTMLGGVWRGTVGKSTKIEYRFTLENNGTMIVGRGLIGVGTKHPLPARAALGWDADAKKVYYLDQHGSDTVYFGHVTRDGNDLLFDFNGLVGDTGHYLSREAFGNGTYEGTMKSETNGVWTDLGFHMRMVHASR